uniref:Sm domain-containing protein n=1 Tax=Mycena chlorophos TaxID=658473 RepID=A0ABQ0KYI3_MYCCL|nr:predicted protein [Mycena chlorophos]
MDPPNTSTSPGKPSASSSTSAIARLQDLLTRMLRVTTTEGRVFIGSFAGTDKPLNILLLNCDEYRISPGPDDNPDGRYVGQILVPWRLVVKVEMHGGPNARAGREAVLDAYI